MRGFSGQEVGQTTYAIFQRTNKTWLACTKTIISNACSRIKIDFAYQTLTASQGEIEIW